MMAVNYRCMMRIPNCQQLKEDNEYPSSTESESYDSSLDGYESFSSNEQLSEDLENDYYIIDGISDQLLESEQAKIRQLRYKISNLTSDLKCQEEKFERTTSKLNSEIKEKDNQVHYLQGQLDKTQSEHERFERDVQMYVQHERNTLMTAIFYQNVDINVLHATIHNLENKLQEAQINVEYLVEISFKQRYQLQGAASHIKELETEISKTIRERERAIQVKTELEVQAKMDESRIRSLQNEINDSDMSNRRKIEYLEKTLEHLKLHSYKKKTIAVTEKHKRRSKCDDEKENEEQLKETNSKKQKSMTSLNKYNSTIERKFPRDQNKQEFITQEDDVKEKELKVTDEQININNLKGQIEKRDQMLKDLKECLTNTQNKDKSDEDLNEVIKEMKERLSEQQKQLKEALSKQKEKEATLEEMKHEIDFERRTKLDLEKKSRENIETITELKSENNKINQRIQALENDIKQRDMELKAFEKRANVDVRTEQAIGNIVRGKDIQIAKLEDQIRQSFARLKETEIELEQTKTRLSKAMGDKLMDNNPNIADLSDENRPVKLAERYSELYDNQWTDAFDFLSKSIDSERSTIEALLNILQDITDFCIASASKQMEDLQGILVFSNTSVRVGDIPVDVRLHLKNFRKALSKTAMRNLYESYISHMKHTATDTLRRAPEVRPYVKECLEICWLMSIQDPPVVFSPVAKQGSILNTNIYKPYTRSGTHVEYTVWPAMLLHEKGPILAKGIAQGRK